jgi:MFS superfamily sulfate permease-like transporter
MFVIKLRLSTQLVSGKFTEEFLHNFFLLFLSFRPPQGPSLGLIPILIKDAIIIAIVSFAICISLAKTYAKKFKYVVDSNQELAAYGLCNVSSVAQKKTTI